MSVSEHVRSIINSCSQTLHASRIIRSRGMNDAELQVTDLLQLLNFYFCFQFLVEVHQRLTGMFGSFPPSSAPSRDKPSEADESLFRNIIHFPTISFISFYPKNINTAYSLRPRSHNYQLTHNHDNKNFIDTRRTAVRNAHSLSQ